ncbi:MAG: hypothetical protein DDT32_01540 [Syntrophomonadaceae bacterium]|nr:hypothetical protein [Bacillota bacterium]
MASGELAYTPLISRIVRLLLNRTYAVEKPTHSYSLILGS